MAQLVRDDNGDTYAVKEDDVQDVNPPKYYQVEYIIPIRVFIENKIIGFFYSHLSVSFQMSAINNQFYSAKTWPT